MGLRSTTNRNARGNTRDRLRRREYLLRVFQADAGPGTCRCYRCGKVLDIDTVTVDRIVPGCHGGTYRRDNIRPACAHCNSATGTTAAQSKPARRAAA
jgi:5-methylcytosine-specific restriction endonuclease McrA